MVHSITFRLAPEHARNRDAQVRAAAGTLNCCVDEITGIRILRRSLDARGNSPKMVLTAEIYFGTPAPALYEPVTFRPVAGRNTAVIVGSGPAGLFAALELIRHNIRPIVLERGKDASARRFDLAPILREGRVIEESNYCFGEGGAGTFSDGKLYTRATKRGPVAEVYRTQITGTEGFGGDYPAIVPMMPTGEKTSAPHLTWTDSPYRAGEAVNLELAGCRHRYHSPLARTAFFGKTPPEKLDRLARHTVEGLNLTLEAIRPGMPCEAVERVWREHIAGAGLEKESRIGYSMGLNYPPDWGEHTASLRPGDTTELRPNMTFHIILGMWMDDYGFECSESFRVTGTGCETFADVPRKLFLIDG